MAQPLYWFGLAGRNPYMVHHFYWERMNKQTHELDLAGGQPSTESAAKIVSFMKRRNVAYIIADDRFREVISQWIPESVWPSFFETKGVLQSNTYGARVGGSKPPFSIQVWKLKRMAQL